MRRDWCVCCQEITPDAANPPEGQRPEESLRERWCAKCLHSRDLNRCVCESSHCSHEGRCQEDVLPRASNFYCGTCLDNALDESECR